MTYISHLEALRWHIIRALAAILIFSIVAFCIAPWIFEHIIFAPSRNTFPTFQFLCRVGGWLGSESLCFDLASFKLQSRQMTGQFSMHIIVSFVIGLIIAFPYICWELWRFVKPALYKTERQNSKGAVAATSLLFLSGVLFGFFVLTPIMVSFFANYRISDMISNEFDITSYVSTVATLVLGTGLLFQLPVIIFFLTTMGILTPTALRKYRKHAVITILVLGALITPTADPISQALIAVPLYILYEIGISISDRVTRTKALAFAGNKI